MPFSIPLLDFLMSAVAGSDSLTSGMLVGARSNRNLRSRTSAAAEREQDGLCKSLPVDTCAHKTRPLLSGTWVCTRCHEPQVEVSKAISDRGRTVLQSARQTLRRYPLLAFVVLIGCSMLAPEIRQILC